MKRNLGWIRKRKQAQIVAQLVALDKKHGCSTFKETNGVVTFKDTSREGVSRAARALTVPFGVVVRP